MKEGRESGILLHITSLPSDHGIGDLGPRAYRFADFLGESGQRLWQVLPLNPTNMMHGNSPYSSTSAFAGNPLLISPEIMVQEGLLLEGEIAPPNGLPQGRVDYSAVISCKEKLFGRAYARFLQRDDQDEFLRFCSENEYWLHDFALFSAGKEHFQGSPWIGWSPDIRDRQPEALEALEEEIHDKVALEKFLQYQFHKQWQALRAYCNQQGIRIFGDVPIYVNHDSADMWTHRDLFKLDEANMPAFVAGVPPDYFSNTGQLWGNPVYSWDVLKDTHYAWWIQRLEHNLRLFDLVRVDHFRGFVAYWEVPADHETAVHGQWVEVPAEDFFSTLVRHFPSLPIIAEDLGIITQDVRDVMEAFGFPGMKLLIFAFGDDLPRNPYAPHNHVEDCLVYTGTHDNNTIRGWFENETTPEDRERIFQYLGRRVKTEEISSEMVSLAMMSVAKKAILPMQDVLGLGQEARMNLPATSEGNWEWRILNEQLSSQCAQELRRMTEIYGRI